MSLLIKLLEELTDLRSHEDEVDELLEHAELAETLTHRVSVMLRTIGDLRVRLDREKAFVTRLTAGLKVIGKLDSLEAWTDPVRYREEVKRVAAEALEEEIPF